MRVGLYQKFFTWAMLNLVLLGVITALFIGGVLPVSYTHLDVYKRQRKSWNLTRGSPARFSTRWSMCSTLSGEIGLPVGLGNTHGLSPVFCFCAFRTPIVSSASGRVR